MSGELTNKEREILERAMAHSANTEAKPESTPVQAPADTELSEADLSLLSASMESRRSAIAARREQKEARAAERLATLLAKRSAVVETAVPGIAAVTGPKVSIIGSLKKETLEKPYIPTVEEAARAGLRCPHIDDYLWATGTADIQLPDDLDLPEEPSPLELVAYAVLPAFVRQYGRRYASRYGGRLPYKIIVKQWVSAMSPKNENDGTSDIFAHELRFVVDRMASQPQIQDFNPRLMAGHAIELRTSDDATDKKHLQEAIADIYPRLSGYEYFFHRTVAPTPEFQPSDWVTMTGYPQYFAVTDIAPNMLDLVNKIVHYRFMTEDEFNPIMGRWLARTLLVVIGCFLREGKPLPAKHVFTLAFRYSCNYIQNVHPHDASFYTTKPIPKFIPPTD